MNDKTDKPTRSRDSVSNTLVVATTLSLVCSLLVASTAIVLRSKQQQNEEQYRQQIILDVAGLYEPNGNIASLFDSIETKMVDLASGEFDSSVSVEGFDVMAAAKDELTGIAIPAAHDVANIRRRARVAPVYFVRTGDRIGQIIIPVYGSGLWSTIRGYLSLAADGSTIRGLNFYEHAETPGLGDQIDKQAWRSIWVDKKLFGTNDLPRIEVIRGGVDENSIDAVHQVDGISGATLTGRGVTNLIRYWTGPHGFGPFLTRIREETSVEEQ